MKIFGGPGVLSEKDKVPDVKDVLYDESYDGNHGGHGGYQAGGHGGGQQSGGVRGGGHRGRGFNRGGGSDRSNWRSSPARCYECDSTKHFAKQCPHRTNNQDVQMNVHIALLTASGSLLSETFGKMLLDSGCSKSVAGVLWYEEMSQTMPESDRKSIVE